MEGVRQLTHSELVKLASSMGIRNADKLSNLRIKVLISNKKNESKFKDSNYKNLIYIVYDRGFRLATYDFKEAISAAFSDSSLVVYDIKNSKTLLDFYCTEDTLYELGTELIKMELINLIPNCEMIYDDLRNKYEEMWNRRRMVNQKSQEEREYQIYLKVKERLALD